ncbi:cell division topological specificity factor MinE [bacterium]|nr:cell division topological specificity factor MinE [bacterium]MBO5447133.1 cell division topological specificity factor MinE [bacterium]
MSENILKELCNRLLSLFKQTETKEENAKDVACNRLRVVLMQDRTNLTPELLQRMRKELVELLSKYVEMDKDALELNFDQEGDQMALMLSIPVIRAKDEEEIEKALAKADEKEAEEDDASDEEIGEREEANEAEDDEETSEENDETEEDNSEEVTEEEPEIVEAEEEEKPKKKEDKE